MKTMPDKNQLPFISKTKYMNGLQCSKLLWYYYNAKDKIPKISPATQALFDQGHVVGEWAKKLFPDGIDIGWNIGVNKVLAKSKELLSKRKPLFEAGFEHNNGYSRIDILNPVGDDEWDTIEVKSSTKLDDVYIDDAAFQKYCCIDSGLKIRKCFLTHINREYVRHGDIDISKLFVIEDITDDVNIRINTVEEELKEMFNIISLKECPNEKIGPQCKDPYTCIIKEICWDFLPEGNVTQLYRLGKRAFDLINKGTYSIKEIPSDYPLSKKQAIQKDAALNNKFHIDKNAISVFLKSIKYPAYFFDLETINPAIPLFDGTRPYQQTPFQFSLHVQKEEGGKTEHYEFLADGQEDPRPKLLSEMKKVFGEEGSIIVYYQSFESGRLVEMAEAFPEYEGGVESLIKRFVDLYKPFSSFSYYSPAQNGSASLKNVLPAVTGRGYDEMPIGEGSAASRAYLRINYTKVPKEEKEKVRKNLLRYCGQDTEGMIWIIDKLKDMVKSGR